MDSDASPQAAGTSNKDTAATTDSGGTRQQQQQLQTEKEVAESPRSPGRDADIDDEGDQDDKNEAEDNDDDDDDDDDAEEEEEESQSPVSTPKARLKVPPLRMNATGLLLPNHAGGGHRVWLGEAFLMKSGPLVEKKSKKPKPLKGKLWRLWQLNYDMQALAYFSSADELPMGYLDVQHMRFAELTAWERENVESIQDKTYHSIKVVTTHWKREKDGKKGKKQHKQHADAQAHRHHHRHHHHHHHKGKDKQNHQAADFRPPEPDSKGDHWVFVEKENQTMILLLNTELMRQSWMRRLESIQDSLRNDASPISSSQEAAARHAAAIAEASTPDGEGGEERVPSPTATGVELLASPPLLQADGFGSRSDSHGSASGLMSGGGSAVPSPRRRRLAARPSEWVVADYVSKRHHKNVDDGGHGVKPEPAIRKLKSARSSVGGDAASVPIAESPPEAAAPFLNPRDPQCEVQILSDVDDTFLCSGGGLLGSDQRFKRKAIYPGAPEMYLGLSLGPLLEAPKKPQGVIWMSARAADTPLIKLFGGRISDRHPISMALAACGRQHGYTFGTGGGLYGKFLHNLHLKATTRNQEKQQQKYNNFIWYLSNGREGGAWTDEKSKKRLELSSPSPTNARRKSSLKKAARSKQGDQADNGNNNGGGGSRRPSNLKHHESVLEDPTRADLANPEALRAEVLKAAVARRMEADLRRVADTNDVDSPDGDDAEDEFAAGSSPDTSSAAASPSRHSVPGSAEGIGESQPQGSGNNNDAVESGSSSRPDIEPFTAWETNGQSSSAPATTVAAAAGAARRARLDTALSVQSAPAGSTKARSPSQTIPALGGRTRQFYFLGDNGEGDEMLALRILQDYGQYMNACFIHNVTGLPPRSDLALSLEDRGRLIYFETYLGAATIAFQRGLLSGESMLRVCSICDSIRSQAIH